jgi:hypothetical protein
MREYYQDYYQKRQHCLPGIKLTHTGKENTQHSRQPDLARPVVNQPVGGDVVAFFYQF